MDKQKKYIWGVLFFEALVCLSLIAVIAVRRKNPEPFGLSLSDWQSNYVTYGDDCWYIDESTADVSDTIDFIYGPYIPIKRGTYTVCLDYACSADQSCMVSATQGNSAYLKTDSSILSRNGNRVSYSFTVTEDIDNLEVLVRYSGIGWLRVDHIEITPDTLGLQRLLTAALFLFLLIDVCYCFRARLKENKNLLCALCGIVLLSSLPLFIKGIAFGHDLRFHLMRIEGIAEELKRGQLPVRLSSLWMDGYGYPVSVYYGDLLLYIPALLRVAGVPITAAYKLYLFFVNAATTVLSYVCFQKIFNSQKIALLTTLVYATAGYRIVCLYVRAAVGEYSTMVFLPVVVLAVYRIYTADEKDWKNYRRHALTLALGMTGLIGTHILSTEMTVLVLFLLAAVLWRRTFRKNTLRVYGLAVFETILFNLYFLIPLFDYYRNVPAVINSTVEEYTPKIQGAGAYIGQYFSFFQNMFGQGNSTTYLSERMGLSPGIALMAVLILAVALWVNRKATREIKFYTVLSAAVLFLASNLFPWDFLAANSRIGDVLAQIQFPWRFLGLASLFLTLLCGYVLQSFSRIESDGRFLWSGKFLLGACMIAACFAVSSYADHASIVDYRDTPGLSTYSVGGGEYLRTKTDIASLQGTISAEGMEEATLLERDGCRMELYCETGAGAGYVEVPMFHYKGCGVTDEFGNIYQISDGVNDRIRFAVPAGFSGQIFVDFAEPWYWRLGELMSAAFAVWIGLARYLQTGAQTRFRHQWRRLRCK